MRAASLGDDVGESCVPQGRHHLGVEVSEGAGDHYRLHVAQDATPTQSIEGEDVDADVGCGRLGFG